MAHDGPLRATTHRPSWRDQPATGRPTSSEQPATTRPTWREQAAAARPTPGRPAPEQVDEQPPPTAPPAAPGTTNDTLTLLAGAVLVAAVLGFVAGGVLWRSEMFAGLIVAPVLILLTLPLAKAARAAVPSFDAGALIMLALGAKLIGVQARYYVIEGVYNGVGDSTGYDGWGRRLAPQFLDLDFTVEIGRPLLGTGFLRYLSGLVYAVVGSHQFAAFLVFGFFAFLGLYLIFRALCLAVPEADHQRYGLLLFLWPSLIFWPASVGKESWMLLCIGIVAYGVARLLVVRPGAFLLIGLGMGGIVLVRPHIAILLGGAIVPAYFLRRGRGAISLGPVTKVIGLLVLVAGFSLVAAQAERFFGFEDLTASSVGDALDRTESQTTTGGSAYEPVVVRNPLQYPWAVVTVLIRPFPTEASNGQMLFTSLEGFALILLIGLSLVRVGSIRSLMRERPYLVFALFYVAMFCFAFAAMGNFGILARQRVQVLPFLFVLLVLPSASKRQRAREPVPRYRTINDRSVGSDRSR
ncbi:MAG: hypothetical protein AAFZ07_23475 [Actinomycetota bacterium]